MVIFNFGVKSLRWYIGGGGIVDLQAKPVSKSLCKLWVRASTAKLYLISCILL